MNEDSARKDNSLFKTLFSQVRLLKYEKVLLRPPPKKIKATQNLEKPVEDQGSIPVLSSADKIFYTKRILPRKTLQHFKKGQYNPEDTIDLHGMISAQAKAELDKFIEESYQANFFVVAVIHGKGRNQTDKPILKNKVNEWLRSYSSVIACCSAPHNDGGAGKVYIMLERSR